MTSKSLQPLQQPQALYKSVQDAIRDYILENELKPGSALPSETQLTKMLGVSRNSVREAVKALQLVGLIESRRGSGIFVGKFSVDPLLDNLPFSLMEDKQQFFDFLEIRRVLETGMIKTAVATITPEQIEELESLLQKMESLAQDDKRFPKEDRLFHQTIYEHLDNDTFIKLLDIFWLMFNRIVDYVDLTRQTPLEIYEKHVAIVRAIKAGDAEEAYQCMARHYDDIKLWG
ncbi:FadR family transcriptional regulator [Phototrophicus methaneseepsis]|uniref:FadR family transcriptional regulator n=1 Tax=Phototrophicus methaneseepsis TaxID=2710758 RepID=A0A7S8E569_9CHLR|nr:FadR/GntR family transcriptional regulator [Phototrophicus methaneseepsis]QPC80524.1 FadR family transcriptional regulator [Phototrophicus methaneseepsis]